MPSPLPATVQSSIISLIRCGIIAGSSARSNATLDNALLLAAVAAAALYAEDYTSKVVAISDADTIKVMHNGAAERIRLWGIDCPEVKQLFGTRAKQFTGDQAFGQVVTVKVRDIDRYKRTVAEIILPDRRNLNLEIVRAGLAWWYQQYARRETVLRDLEQEARAAKRGLWSDPKPVAPGSGGRREPRRVSSEVPVVLAGSFCVQEPYGAYQP